MRATLAAAALAFATPALAQTFPARSGETGILDVPDADVVGLYGGQLGVEVGVQRTAGERTDSGALPMYVVGGLGRRLDLGLTMRQFGQPGDPRPPQVVFGTAAKLQLIAPDGFVPGVAVSTIVDRFNANGILGARLAVSAGGAPFRIAAFGGFEGQADGLRDLEPTGGVAASLALTRRVAFVAEALTGGRGDNFGAAIRWASGKNVGVSIGANWFPGDDTFRAALTFAFSPPKPRAEEPAPVGPTPPEATVPVAAGPRFTDDRPHFRLRMAERGPQDFGAAGHLQHGPTTPRLAAATAVTPKPEPGTRAAAPSLDDLADAQVREQETLAETRERRVRSTAEQLDVREKAALDEQKRLGDRERELADREQQLDARQRMVPVKGPPTQQQRQLESLEAQLASQERSLAAQERSYLPALDAAQGRQRDATAREETERQETNRLAASAGGAASRALQIDIRKQANAARNRQLAAFEARLVARGEYIDALERQLRTKNERLEAWSRRLDARAERLDLVERLGTEPKPAPGGTKPAGAATGAAAPKDRAAFVMVVKSPTAVVKERASGAGTAAPAASVHAGVAVEKAVAAATVLMFPTPTSQLSELDVEALTNIAKLAAKQGCELLIWARAKDPSAMAEAQRRATDIQTRAIAAGPLDPNQVVTRITVRPGAKGVDVVVSALRETARPAAAPAAPQSPKLLSGESGNRQLREAVQVAQASIEACIGELMDAKRLSRAEGVLKVSVGTTARVTRVATGAGDISGGQVEECLGAASKAWVFPSADSEYVVDVPITVIRGGAK